MEPRDEELLDAFYTDGDIRHLGDLLNQYSLLLFGFCMKYLKSREEARDAVQQIFLKVIEDLPKTQVRHFRGWLYTVARNQCLMTLRKKGHPVSIETSNVEPEAINTDWTALLEKEQALNRLEEALASLKPEQKKCIELFYLQRQSYQAIATKTNFSLLQVKSHIQNGKRNLKLFMEAQLKRHEQS
jgi:RNA polymerase sigma factor (sigma-70 family)